MAWDFASNRPSQRAVGPAEVNAELLAACKAAASWLESWASAEPYLSELRAAIAHAERSCETCRNRARETGQECFECNANRDRWAPNRGVDASRLQPSSHHTPEG
jgi:hypothetical protein